MKKIKSTSLTQAAKQEIYQYIRNNYNGKDTKLPTEDQFSQLLGVSRNTVRSALNDLAGEGIIFRKHGKGTFLNPEAMTMKVSFSPVSLFIQMIENFGYQPSIKILPNQLIKANSKIALALNIEEGDKVIFARKIFFADGNPCSYCEDYFAYSLLSNPDDINRLQDYQESLFTFLAETTGNQVIWDKVELATCTNIELPKLTEHFQCSENEIRSFLLLNCVNFDQNDYPVVFAHEYIDTNYIQFNSIRYKDQY